MFCCDDVILLFAVGICFLFSFFVFFLAKKINLLCLRSSPSPTDLPVPQLQNSDDFPTKINPEPTVNPAERCPLKDEKYKQEIYERALQPITGMTYDNDCVSIEYVYYDGELSDTDADEEVDTLLNDEQQKREIYRRILQPITGKDFESDSAVNEFVYYTGESSEDEQENFE